MPKRNRDQIHGQRSLLRVAVDGLKSLRNALCRSVSTLGVLRPHSIEHFSLSSKSFKWNRSFSFSADFGRWKNVPVSIMRLLVLKY